MKLLYFISLVFAIVGSINWGLVGLADIDLVKLIFGEKTLTTKAVYSLVGLSGLFLTYYIALEMLAGR